MNSFINELKGNAVCAHKVKHLENAAHSVFFFHLLINEPLQHTFGSEILHFSAFRDNIVDGAGHLDLLV